MVSARMKYKVVIILMIGDTDRPFALSFLGPRGQGPREAGTR